MLNCNVSVKFLSDAANALCRRELSTSSNFPVLLMKKLVDNICAGNIYAVYLRRNRRNYLIVLVRRSFALNDGTCRTNLFIRAINSRETREWRCKRACLFHSLLAHVNEKNISA